MKLKVDLMWLSKSELKYYGIIVTDYDWDEIKDNARKAREAFEKRALNQILKREEFVASVKIPMEMVI